MTGKFRVIPTLDHPARAIPVEVDRAMVSGDYQCVVALPDKPSKGQLLLAFAEACRSLTELAEKWASEEGVMVDPSDDTTIDRDFRVIFQLRLQPENGVDHAKLTFAPTFRGL